MGTCHPMATLKYIDSVTSFPVCIKLLFLRVLPCAMSFPCAMLCLVGWVIGGGSGNMLVM